jgi:flavin reductase (DIM6/NTAB) family NADH-FMN oxidoreductase RutF
VKEPICGAVQERFVMSEDELRQIMERMPYGLYIIGSKMEEGVNAMMADWVMQVSFNPRLLAVSFENDARTLANITSNRVFTVNFLSENEAGMHLASRFAQPYFGSKVHGPQATGFHKKLQDIPHELTSCGCPVLTDAMAWLQCEAKEFVAIGDHTMVIAEVEEGKMVHEGEPLTSKFTGWKYSG